MALLLAAPFIAAAPRPSACTATDMAIYQTKGEGSFAKVLQTCGKQCVGGPACLTSCISKAEGYSDPCSSCFGDLAKCTKTYCLLQCHNGNSPACSSCVTENQCDADFVTCSGITPAPPASGAVGLSELDPVDAQASNCTGAAVPTTFPQCYKGGHAVFGLMENFVITVKAFNASTNTGTLDMIATGLSAEQCYDKSFTKSGQDITVDISKCASGATATAKFCSDQNAIALSVTLSKVPIPLMAGLATNTPCTSAVVEEA